ncbi:uncharacterized protein LY89DRAFT_573685 [Mollisia scopiformis]|uniref:RRM domain-containing protein n=1 Tax=Mollisia scopiformis TaxID=149040 RepID=A0A194XT21_MOLSC|nr:uncharacterized protein LY89DRAFT_573685 [Mollisia scopiformis]KUJ23348.1 hypothetical protein LY89DRAFT_573685 [Mollisia scopiformis]
MNLLNDAISGHEVSRLGSINESDPFVGNTPASATRSNPPLLNNPFGPHQLTIANKNAYQQGVSVELLRLTNNCTSRPTADVAVDSIPFVEYCRLNRTYNHGVIKLKNIPYTVNRPEVLAFLGRNARIISEQDFEPVHIVMERVTSKTLDCYVEFADLNEAVAAVNRYENNRMTGRNGRLGQRHVDMELSSQDALMKDLFPKAKNVNWRDGKPTIIPTNPHDKYNSGFQGFISKEELVMLVKHVETPQRSPFSKECPQRPYECLISTLFKYPWYMVDYITIEDRDLLYDATSKLLDLLRDRLKSTPEQDINLSPMLYKRVWRAAIKCQGFTPTMKDNIAFKHELPSDLMQEMGVPLFAADWHYLWTIGPKPGAPHDIILWYAAVMREYLDSKKEQVPLADKAAKGEKLERAKLFGDLEKYFGHPVDRKVFGALTLAQVAANEWSGIETVLRLALAPAIEAPASA